MSTVLDTTMTNDELAREGFELCEMDGDCDFCHQDIPQGEYFWRRTSYEYVEGDYSCRACAVAWLAQQQALYDSYEQSIQYCPTCSAPLDWVECDNCDENGYTDHDCGEDCCCCLDPEPNVECDICDGAGGWWHCFNTKCLGKQETK